MSKAGNMRGTKTRATTSKSIRHTEWKDIKIDQGCVVLCLKIVQTSRIPLAYCVVASKTFL